MTSPSSTVSAPTAGRARPGYAAMRMVAEWASGIRDETLHFSFKQRHAILSLEPRADAISMRTRSFTARPKVASVEISVTFEGKPYPLVISGHDHSALFWSESSIEKFLFPYFASVAAEGAGRFFRKLTNAWYRYHPDEVQVCAIAFGCGPKCPAGKTRLTLERMVSLVCLVPNGGAYDLELVALDSFARRFPSRGKAPTEGAIARMPLDPHRETGWKVNGCDGNIVARDAAEFVSGLRGYDVDFAAASGELTPWLPSQSRTPGTEWIPCGMDAVRGDRPAPSSVVLSLEGHHDAVPILPAAGTPAGDPAMEPDSFFWSDGAVEKLLAPYYGSVKGLAAPAFTALLIGAWNGLLARYPGLGPSGVVEVLSAFLQDPDPAGGAAFDGSTDDGSTDDGSTDDGSTDDVPYGVTHLPRSEYIPDALTTSAVESRTRFLTLANPRGQRLSDFTVGR
ncbi:MAG TPA: hypothetical protein VE913_24160 [Longimicrobium sp.]|nr:hypothetical protein [Longimicrobium sp.]